MASKDFTFVMDEKDYQNMRLILDGFSKVDQATIVQNALRQGMTTIIAQGKSNLALRNKKKTGNLAKSFGIRVNKRKGVAIGGHRRPAGAHAHLIDRGTNKRWTKKGAYRGSISKGSPNHGSGYWTDAVMSQGPKAQAGLMDAVYDSIQKIIDRNKS